MAFNHYAKINRILAAQPDGWFVMRIDEPTTAKTFKDELRKFDHYYRIYGSNNQPIKYCKFQQIDLLAKSLHILVEDLPIVS